MSILKKSQKSLISIYSLRVVLELFTSTFLVSYIVTLNPENIFGTGLLNVAIFYISWFFVYIISNFVISFFVDKSNRLSLLRLGIFVSLTLLIAIVIWGKQLSEWIILAGALCGVSDGFFYPSYYVVKNELSENKTNREYNLVATVLENLVKIIVPTILGYIIDVSSFSRIAIYITFVALVQFGLTFLLKSTRPNDSKFELMKYFKFLKEDKFARNKIKYTYLNAFFAGFKTAYRVIIIVLTIYAFKTNLSLGFYTSIFSTITIILLIFSKRIDNNKNINKFPLYLILGLLPLIGAIVLVLFTNKYVLIAYGLTSTIALNFSGYLGSVERDAIIKNLDKYDFIAEHQFVHEALQCISRIIAYLLFIVASLFTSINAFKVLIVVLLLMNPIKFVIMYKQRQIRLEFENNKEKQIEQKSL